jgi:hypothetical protein
MWRAIVKGPVMQSAMMTSVRQSGCPEKDFPLSHRRDHLGAGDLRNGCVVGLGHDPVAQHLSETATRTKQSH